MEHKNEGLQLEDDPDFLRKDWKFERIGWGLLLLLVLAAIAGLFGRGGLLWNQAVAGDKGAGLQVEYSEFWRQEAPEEMAITMAGADTVLEVHTSQMHLIKVENMLPQPEHAEFTSDKITLTYKPAAADRNILIYISPLKMGSFKASVKAGRKAPVDVNVFIYP